MALARSRLHRFRPWAHFTHVEWLGVWSMERKLGATPRFGVTQSSTIINAHHVSQASVQSPCAHHVSPRAGQIVNFCATRKPARAEKTSNLKLSRCQRLSQRAGARQRDFSHGCRGRGVRYSGTIINAHHVSEPASREALASVPFGFVLVRVRVRVRVRK